MRILFGCRFIVLMFIFSEELEQIPNQPSTLDLRPTRCSFLYAREGVFVGTPTYIQDSFPLGESSD